MAHINLQKIVSVKRQSGLFHLINYSPKGYFLQPFEGGPTRFYSNEKGKVLAVGNVDLQLRDGSINLLEIFHIMKGQTNLPSNATKSETAQFFNSIIPNLKEEIASSHLEKVYRWYHVIADHHKSNEMINQEDDGLTIV